MHKPLQDQRYSKSSEGLLAFLSKRKDNYFFLQTPIKFKKLLAWPLTTENVRLGTS